MLNKLVYLMPFIFIYKLLVSLIKILFSFIKHFNVGLFFTIYVFAYIVVYFLILVFKGVIYSFVLVSYLVFKIIRYVILGIWVFVYCFYRFIRYVILGFAFPFVYLFGLISKLRANKVINKQKDKQREKELTKERNKQIQEENAKRLQEIRRKEKEEEARKKQEAALKKEKKHEKELYLNENVKIERKPISSYINDFFKAFGAIPAKIKNKFRGIGRNKDTDINRQALLLDFEGADAEKSSEKIMYKYVAKNPNGKIIKGYFPAYSKVEVHSFLLSEGNEVYSIETNRWIKLMYGSGASLNKKKIKTKDLIFFTTQLSTYLKAGITLVESLKILSRQFKNKDYSRIFRSLIYDLSMGDSLSQAMDKQGEAFPKLFINMVKASEMTGELPEVLDDMEEYFTEVDKTRKQMVTAMTYPTIIFIFAIAAVIFIMVYVVPKFVAIYEGIDGSTIPGITIFVMNLSNFLQNNWVLLIAVTLVIIFIFIYLYKNVKAFKSFIQWVLMHLPVVGNVIIYNEVTMFTKTFASLLAHNVFITDSMDILKRLTNNEVYKSLIFETIDNLAKGEKISLAFEDHWAFPMPAYEMIKTGEMTGQLPEMMSKVSSYYQELHKNSVTRIKTFVEPVLILFLTVIVGGIVLSIVIPMFNVYNAVQM